MVLEWSWFCLKARLQARIDGVLLGLMGWVGWYGLGQEGIGIYQSLADSKSPYEGFFLRKCVRIEQKCNTASNLRNLDRNIPFTFLSSVYVDGALFRSVLTPLIFATEAKCHRGGGVATARTLQRCCGDPALHCKRSIGDSDLGISRLSFHFSPTSIASQSVGEQCGLSQGGLARHCHAPAQCSPRWSLRSKRSSMVTILYTGLHHRVVSHRWYGKHFETTYKDVQGCTRMYSRSGGGNLMGFGKLRSSVLLLRRAMSMLNGSGLIRAVSISVAVRIYRSLSTSMFRWYRSSRCCLAYLAEMSGHEAFKEAFRDSV